MDDLFNIFVNTVVNQYDQRRRPQSSTAASLRLIDLYTSIEQDLTEQLEIVSPLETIRNYDNDQSFTSNRNYDNDPSFALNRDLVDNLHTLRRYYETLTTTVIDELNNIEVDLSDFVDLEDVKVTLSEDQFNSLELRCITDETLDKCNVCLDDFCLGTEIITLNCRHFFHRDCIKPWLMTQSHKCPVCRADQK